MEWIYLVHLALIVLVLRLAWRFWGNCTIRASTGGHLTKPVVFIENLLIAPGLAKRADCRALDRGQLSADQMHLPEMKAVGVEVKNRPVMSEQLSVAIADGTPMRGDLLMKLAHLRGKG